MTLSYSLGKRALSTIGPAALWSIHCEHRLLRNLLRNRPLAPLQRDPATLSVDGTEFDGSAQAAGAPIRKATLEISLSDMKGSLAEDQNWEGWGHGFRKFWVAGI